MCLNNLGEVRCALGEYAEARHCFHQALKFAFEIGATPVVLEVLGGAARLLAASQGGRQEAAAQLLAFVLSHPASNKPTRDAAERRLAELATQLSPEAMATAQERGQADHLERVVAEMLAELGF